MMKKRGCGDGGRVFEADLDDGRDGVAPNNFGARLRYCTVAHVGLSRCFDAEGGRRSVRKWIVFSRLSLMGKS
jgi:hypothetical protein